MHGIPIFVHQHDQICRSSALRVDVGWDQARSALVLYDFQSDSRLVSRLNSVVVTRRATDNHIEDLGSNPNPGRYDLGFSYYGELASFSFGSQYGSYLLLGYESDSRSCSGMIPISTHLRSLLMSTSASDHAWLPNST